MKTKQKWIRGQMDGDQAAWLRRILENRAGGGRLRAARFVKS
jgi:hypothetical protein